jgi:hypothetical protein
MAAKKEKEALDQEEPQNPPGEDRIDAYAIERFGELGYDGRLPDSLVATYQAFRRRKHRMHPGPLSPEAFVTVLFLAGLIDKEY